METFEKGRRLAGKAAIVTGAGSGIGAAIARLFAAQGAAVAATDLDAGRLAETLEQIRSDEGDAVSFPHDVTSEADWAAAVKGAVAAFGKIDILVNNAGVHPQLQLGAITLEDWNRVLAIDLTGPFLGTQSVLPEMQRIGGGAIVNISSVSAFVGGPYSHYNAAKAGVRALTRSTAVTYGKQDIRANAIYPGLIETRLTENMLADPAFVTRLEATIPLPRFGTGGDVAYGALYLASDEARFVTGSDLIIDGGRTLR